MKKLVSCIIALTMFAGGLFCAQQANDQKNAKVAPPAKESRAFLGVTWNHTKIKTDSNRKGGNPYALVAGYEYIKPDFLYVYGEVNWGVAKIKGSNHTYTGYGHDYNFEGHVGWTFGLGEDNEFAIIPFVGVTYVYAKDSNYTSTYYKDETRTWMVPFGVYVAWDIIPNLNIGIKAGGSWDISDKTVIKSGSNDGESSKAKKEVDWGVELPIKYNLSPDWALSLIPYYTAGKFTPKTNTTIFGTSTIKAQNIGGTIELGYCF